MRLIDELNYQCFYNDETYNARLLAELKLAQGTRIRGKRHEYTSCRNRDGSDAEAKFFVARDA